MKLTLDTNCVIALESGEVQGEAVRRIVEAHRAGRAQVSLSGISASERQRCGTYRKMYSRFSSRLARLGLSDLPVLKPQFGLGVTFLDEGYLGDETTLERLQAIHRVLFPSLEPDYRAFCAARGLDPLDEPGDPKWLNALCDAEALASHIFYEGDVFVTDDRNFHKSSKKPQLLRLGAGRIERAAEAASMVG